MAKQVDQTAPTTEVPLIFDGGGRIRIRCPWCETWEPEEAFVELQTPPNYPEQCGIVLKHRCPPTDENPNGSRAGHGKLFTIRNYRRPREAM